MKWMVPLICGLFTCYSVHAQTGLDSTSADLPGDSSFYVVDSVAVSIGAMQDLSPEKIASISVVSGAGMVRKYGEKAANGVIYIETKAFARKHYTALFAAHSPAYKKLLATYKGDDSHFAYVLNERVLAINPEGELSGIKDNDLRAISVMPAADLERVYNIKGKAAGVIITTGSVVPGDGAYAGEIPPRSLRAGH